MSDRLTLPWALLVLFGATFVGIVVNHQVAAEWVAPLAMALMMGGLFFYGRIERREPPANELDRPQQAKEPRTLP